MTSRALGARTRRTSSKRAIQVGDIPEAEGNDDPLRSGIADREVEGVRGNG